MRSGFLAKGAIAAAVAIVSCSTASSFGQVVNRFDTAAEVNDWRFDFGGAAANRVQSFSTDDAAGLPTSGSMRLDLTYGGGNNAFAYTNDEYADPGVNLSGMKLEFDLKIDPASAVDAFGNNGNFDFVVRNTNNYNYNGLLNANVNDADGWKRFSVILGANANAARAYTLQLYGGPDQNINGTVGLLIDNIVVSPVPEPTTLAALGASTMLLRRRRR